MNETTFENAKVGDRVWDSGYGWGVITGIGIVEVRPLTVLFDISASCDYNTDGHYNPHVLRTLFWDEIKFEAPPRPKRMVKKVVDGWVNITEGDRMSCLYATEKTAITVRGRFVVYYGEPLFIHHEYEVEE